MERENRIFFYLCLAFSEVFFNMSKSIPVKDQSLFALSWPLCVTFGIGMMLPMLDSWFLSRRSVEAAAGVGALMPVLVTVFMAIQAFAQAGASIASQFLGGGRPRHARITQTLVIAGSAILGLFMGGALFPLTPYLVDWMGLSGEAAHAARQFLHVVGLGLVFRSLQGTLTSLIATHGRTFWNLVANVITIVVNVALNYIFLSGRFGTPDWLQGVYGVATATVVAWVVSCIFLWIVMIYDLEHATYLKDLRRGYRVLLPEWLRIGVPAAIEPVSFQVFQVFITALFVRQGEVAMASRVFAGAFAAFATIISVGLGSGSQILVAHLVGNREFDKASSRMHQSLVWSAVSAFLVAAVVALCGTQLLSLYTQNAPNAQEILALGSALLWCDVILQPFKAANIVLTNALRASGDSSFPAVFGTISMWTLGLGTTLLLCYGAGSWVGLGAIGLWLGMATDELYRSIANYLRWRSGVWKRKGVMVK
jgi:putative MATE family efflux protein